MPRAPFEWSGLHQAIPWHFSFFEMKSKTHCSHTEQRPIGELKPHPRNPNTHSAGQLKLLAKIIEAQGWRNPIVVSKSSGLIVAGHARLEAAKLLGMKTVPVDVQTFKDTDAELAHLLADNRIAELAEMDGGSLKDLLLELDTGALDMDLTGYDHDALEELMTQLHVDEEPVDAEPKIDQASELQKKWGTKLGQVWELGDHRIACGDSTSAEVVGRLMGDEKAEMMFTDPPYGVSYEGGHFHSGNVKIKRKREKLAADDSTTIYPEFLPVALSVVDGPCYMWFADSKARDVYNAVYDAGCEVHSLIIWHKTNATYAAMNAQYKQRHEPCLYFKPRGSTLRWCGASTEATVWNQDRDGINEFHPTQKPIALAAKALGNHEAKIIFDAFSGSGSTLIACENLGRKCRAIELSPEYVAVAIERWVDVTGKEPRQC